MAQTFSRPIQLALDNERRILWLVALFPLLAVMLTAILKLMPRLYMFLIREDSVVEWATAVVYIVAAGFAVGLVLHFRRHQEWIYVLLYGVLGAGMFLIAMEEISWGQRQLGIKTPPFIADLNYKGELNFHNLSAFPVHEAFIAVGFYGAFARLIATPLLIKRFPKFVDLLTPPYVLCLFFFIPFVYYARSEFLYYTEVLPRGLQWSEYWATEDRFIIGKDQEPIELLLALGFLLFTVLNWVRYRVGAPLMLGGSAGAIARGGADMRHLGVAALLAGIMLTAAPPQARAGEAPTATDANLVTALDVSDSIMRHEEWIEFVGMIHAIQSDEFLEASTAGRHGRIGFAVIVWSSDEQPDLVVPWTIIESKEDVQGVVDRLGVARQLYGFNARMGNGHGVAAYRGDDGGSTAPARWTDVSAALDFSADLLRTAPFLAPREVINICGNGADNVHASPAAARDRALSAGMVVNGLVIGARPDVIDYYRAHVQGGTGSFVLEVSDPKDVAAAMLQKFLRDLNV